MTPTEHELRGTLLRQADAVRVGPQLAGRIDRRRRRSRPGVGMLAAVTGAVVALLVVLAASALVGDGTYRPGAAPESASSPFRMPSDVEIVPPARGVPAAAAAFSGTWEGKWDGSYRGRLVVERVTATSARVVYVWGPGPDGTLAPGWRRFTAGVSGNRIEWGRDTLAPEGNGPCDAHGDSCSIVRFVFTLSPDGKSIHGVREVKGYESMANHVTMHRVRAHSFDGKAAIAVAALIAIAGVFATRRARAR